MSVTQIEIPQPASSPAWEDLARPSSMDQSNLPLRPPTRDRRVIHFTPGTFLVAES